MEKDRGAEQKPKAKLGGFVEDNQKLISVLGIFTALAAFSNNIAIPDFGYMLSLPCLAAVILLWFEIIGRMPHSDRQEFPLTMFHYLVSAVVLTLAAYLFVQYRDIWRQVIPLVLVILVLAAVASPASRLKERVESRRRFREFVCSARLTRLLSLVWILSVLFFSFVGGTLLSLPVIRVLDRIDEGVTKSELAKNRQNEASIQFDFKPGKYCCYKAQAAGTTCQHTCCVLARIDGAVCAKCVPRGSAILKPKKGVPVTSPNITATSNTGTVTIAIEGADSEIFVDGSFVGNSSARVPLLEGKHVIEIIKPGYKDYKRELTITTGAELELHPFLERK